MSVPHLRPNDPQLCLGRRCCAAFVVAFLLALAAPDRLLQANPAGLTVVQGNAQAVSGGPQLTITASHNAVLQWQSFNILPGETTTFVQPSASSVVWNRIQDQNPSQIWGHLNANGVVVLMNSSGFFFGPGSVVQAAGLVATTMTAPPETGSGGLWQFSGAPPSASIVNYGAIGVGPGGGLFLIAEKVSNHGLLTAPDGTIGLYAGKELLVSERPDGRGLSAEVRLPAGSVDNTGRLVADAGHIALHARVVNQSGILQADSVRERNGVIELVASDLLSLEASSSLHARGDATATGSNGGEIRLHSGGAFIDRTGSLLDVATQADRGDGGQVEISASLLPAIYSVVDGSPGAGGRGGSLVIDPTDIVLTAGGGTPGPDGVVAVTDPPDTLRLGTDQGFLGLAQITLQASRDIIIEAGTVWNLAASTGVSTPGSSLTLQAGRDVVVQNNAGIIAGPGWSLSLQAGANLSGAGGVRAGEGDVRLLGNGFLQASDGSISLLAGAGVRLESGSIVTAGGGSIHATALAGDLVTGTRPNGFLFRPSGAGYLVDPSLGGISTAGGGDVTLTAGRDVVSFLPASTGSQTDGGSGAFGAAPGNVTVTAGRNVEGHYVVRNGTGTITAGANAGTSERALALSLISGGWSVTAGQDILLQEVRNPNGIFNNLGFSNSSTKHRFDYSADAFLRLAAGDGIALLGSPLPRNSGLFEQSIPAIYPPILDIQAGAGGVSLGNDVILFPSPLGDLSIRTTDGGSVFGTKAGDLVRLIVSDSARSQYSQAADFGIDDHAATPVHLGRTDPLTLEVSGDLSGILLGFPRLGEIHVGGHMINSRFEGQNLGSGHVTRLWVEGDILNRNEFTTVMPSVVPDFTVFDLAYPSLTGTLAALPNQFVYNPVTHTLTFRGRMTGEQLRALDNLQVLVVDPISQVPLVGSDGLPIIAPGTFIDSTSLHELFTRSQDVPLNPDTGYRIGGGGSLEVRARNLDLGATLGIVSVGPAVNPALARIAPTGAAIAISLRGNLDMFSTTISSIAGGAITIQAAGSVNVGSRDFDAGDERARGIFTVVSSDVEVVAGGDIQVNGSRIAAFDGGDITVVSLGGDVDAGSGGRGAVTVEKVVVDPTTGRVLSYTPTIPGSGILATTFPPALDAAFPNSTATVGNIRVETPRGNIIASAGGIVQLPLNGVNTTGGEVRLIAGSRDAAGNVTHAGTIDASGSGVIGGSVFLEATGEIEGLVFARENIDITSQQNVNVTALAQGSVNVQAGGTISGSVIGIGSVNASATSIEAGLLSQNVSSSGSLGASSQVGFAQASVASTAGQSAGAQASEAPAGASTVLEGSQPEEEDPRKRGGPAITLARTTGRVTVILPTR